MHACAPLCMGVLPCACVCIYVYVCVCVNKSVFTAVRSLSVRVHSWLPKVQQSGWPKIMRRCRGEIVIVLTFDHSTITWLHSCERTIYIIIELSAQWVSCCHPTLLAFKCRSAHSWASPCPYDIQIRYRPMIIHIMEDCAVCRGSFLHTVRPPLRRNISTWLCRVIRDQIDPICLAHHETEWRCLCLCPCCELFLYKPGYCTEIHKLVGEFPYGTPFNPGPWGQK